MALPERIQTAIDADLTDMVAWSSLLNLFSEFQSDLSLPEKIIIYHKCEEFRNFWNQDRVDIYHITRNSGEKVEQKKYIKSLDIKKSDMFPDNIYSDIELIIDYFQIIPQKINLHPTTDSGRDTDLIGEVPALAI